ncbi:hypothetical protein AAZR23_17270 [Morganella sp. Je.2.23]|uniref:hypothetical protein n=1 Tax=Morganella sp. Je.2.23 TaxID=3142840 RepID=UPI003DAA01DD
MLPETSIILVDNDQSELDILSSAFFKSGISCLPLLYDSKTGVNSYNLKPSVNIRWLFMDLNLEDLPSNEAASFIGPIVNVIESLVSGGMYSLIFWSKHESIIDDIVERIKVDSYLHQKIPCPIQILKLDKTSFKDSDDLKNSLLKYLDSPPMIKSLYQWEELTNKSVDNVINKIHSLANTNKTWDIESLKSNISNILSLLAYESTGIKMANDESKKSLNNGLLSIVEDEYNNISSENIWDDYCLIPYKNLDLSELSKSNLNTYLFVEDVDFNNLNDKTFDKGVMTFVKNNREFINDFINNENCINEEFFNYNSNGDKYIDDLIIGSLEVSPDCDHANRKVKLNRFLLAALIPKDKFEELNKNNKYNDGVFGELPYFMYNNKQYKLMISYKYLFSISKNDTALLSLFESNGIRIKENILSKVRSEMSRHISRLGYMAIH